MLHRLVPAVAAVAISASAFAQTLSLGDAMPTIGDDADWLQGSPVSAWEDGQIYVLDFWATWCGPCIRSIPHINELSKEHAADGVNVIGMAVWPREGMTPTAEFVEEKGDEMSYRIAEDVEGKLAERYMNATNSSGIPTIMIVDREGRYVWKGHPMDGFDEALASVIDGTFDIDAAIKQQELSNKADGFLMTANQKAGAGDWSGAIDELKKVTEIDGYSQAGYYAMVVVQVMAAPERGGQPEAAMEYARTLPKRFADDSMIFPYLADFIATGPLDDEVRDLDLALKMAKMGIKNAAEDEFFPYAALASVHHAAGDYDAAIKAQTKAIAMATEAGEADAVKELESALDEFKSHATN